MLGCLEFYFFFNYLGFVLVLKGMFFFLLFIFFGSRVILGVGCLRIIKYIFLDLYCGVYIDKMIM